MICAIFHPSFTVIACKCKWDLLWIDIYFPVILLHEAMLAWYMRLSICLSVHHTPVLYQNS